MPQYVPSTFLASSVHESTRRLEMRMGTVKSINIGEPNVYFLLNGSCESYHNDHKSKSCDPSTVLNNLNDCREPFGV